MRLFLKRDTSFEHSRYIVYDECKREKYIVTGRRGASVDRMVISTPDGKPCVNIRIAPFHVFYAFSISNGSERFTMTASNLRGRVEYRFHGISWTLIKSRDLRSFELIDADTTPVMIQLADSFSVTGAYNLEIFCKSRELFCISSAICADVINYADRTQAATV